MGVDWFHFYVLYGIKIRIETVPLVWEALVDNESRCLKGFTKEFPITVKMYETVTHSSTDCEGSEETLHRCMGFLGVICANASCERICEFRAGLDAYFNEHKEILIKLGIRDVSPRVYGGIYHDLSKFWDIDSESSSYYYHLREERDKEATRESLL